jgi:lipoprotein-anchoring transpeptidase ErfK/SrfK
MTDGRSGDGLFGGRRLLFTAAVLVAFAAPATGVTSARAAGSAIVPRATPSVVARAKGRLVRVYRSPGARRPYLTLKSPTSEGFPLVFLVQKRRRGWDRVYLPVRPNGSIGWIRDSGVSLALDPYHVVVSLTTHRVTVWKGAKVILREPAGVGRAALPTPSGTYFIVELLKQPNPHGVYGPYAFGLSAFSNVLTSFGGGPGQIGLHGTDDPSRLGTNVSHGCIRISNAGITRLARLLPLGTPVLITRRG